MRIISIILFSLNTLYNCERPLMPCASGYYRDEFSVCKKCNENCDILIEGTKVRLLPICREYCKAKPDKTSANVNTTENITTAKQPNQGYANVNTTENITTAKQPDQGSVNVNTTENMTTERNNLGYAIGFPTAGFFLIVMIILLIPVCNKKRKARARKAAAKISARNKATNDIKYSSLLGNEGGDKNAEREAKTKEDPALIPADNTCVGNKATNGIKYYSLPRNVDVDKYAATNGIKYSSLLGNEGGDKNAERETKTKEDPALIPADNTCVGNKAKPDKTSANVNTTENITTAKPDKTSANVNTTENITTEGNNLGYVIGFTTAGFFLIGIVVLILVCKTKRGRTQKDRDGRSPKKHVENGATGSIKYSGVRRNVDDDRNSVQSPSKLSWLSKFRKRLQMK